MTLTTEHPSSRLVMVHQGALGDFLLALPVFEGLHRLYPDALMDFCSRLEHPSLLAAKPYFGVAHPADSPALASLFLDDCWRDTQVPAYFLGARSIFWFGQSGSRILADRLAQLVPCPLYWLQSFPAPGRNQPVAEFLLDQLRQQGVRVEYVTPKIEPQRAEREVVREWLRSAGWQQKPKPVMIHPGSGGRRKIWPLRKWWALLRWLRGAYDHPLCMVLGQADQHLRPFAVEARRLGVGLLENLSLPRLAAFMAASRLFLGNDSGVSHLAAAVGVPTVAIFGPTPPEVWAPRGAEVCVIRSRWNELENLRWPQDCDSDEVDDQVRRAVAVMLKR